MEAKKVFVWLGVMFVLCFCFLGSCLLAGYTVSEEGRHGVRGLMWDAKHLGGEDREKRRAGGSYNLTFNDDGSSEFYGDGLRLSLPAGYKPDPDAVRNADAPAYDYYVAGPGGKVQLRLRRENRDTGYDPWYGESDARAFFKHAEEYAREIGGEAALKSHPLAVVPASTRDQVYADEGYEGCFAYAPDMYEKTGFEGEYFVMYQRGFENAVLVSVAFKPFDREAALLTGRRLAEGFHYD